MVGTFSLRCTIKIRLDDHRTNITCQIARVRLTYGKQIQAYEPFFLPTNINRRIEIELFDFHNYTFLSILILIITAMMAATMAAMMAAMMAATTTTMLMMTTTTKMTMMMTMIIWV